MLSVEPTHFTKLAYPEPRSLHTILLGLGCQDSNKTCSSDSVAERTRRYDHPTLHALFRGCRPDGRFVFSLPRLSHRPRVRTTGKPFEAKFWQFLIGNNYKNWAPAPGQDGNFYSGQVPHGALLKMYINRTAAANIEGLKIGSVVVLENYRSDRSLKSISVMYRTEGLQPCSK